jgi:hypothetical protein
VPSSGDGREGGELLASALVQDSIGVGLYTVTSSLTGQEVDQTSVPLLSESTVVHWEPELAADSPHRS